LAPRGRGRTTEFRPLSLDEIAFIRAEVVRASQRQPEPLAPSDGAREQGGILRSAMARSEEGPLAGPDDIFVRMALLLRGIVEEHAYVNGNKRTGLAVLGTQLRMHGFTIPDATSTEEFVARVAMSEEDIDSMADWLRANATDLRGES
jgi:death on curing protein